ncbi:hypothetical protein QQF64_003174 [Cirrhinus molitorella]|uniref:Uncharacterized protein n=1 Tax=Cirrhinus molitorella TaxID=172907 RepID=A0ABR3MJ83_9TELE
MGDEEWMSCLRKFAVVGITKKLSGFAKGTALWLTSVSNEVGQMLISVLTAQEGPALDTMAADLIRRYSNAGVAPPQLLYIDCQCCREGTGQSKLKQRFGGWPDLVVKLDIYHFMRRLASGCTKDAHPLYPIFMSRLSSCILEWDSGDVALLRQAKREQRRTSGERQMIIMIELLLNELMGVKGRDFLGVPLLDHERMKHIWQIQKKHVKCIQDEAGLNRWNQDREAASLAVRPPSLLSYSGDLVHCVNNNSVKVLGRKLVPSFQPPTVYTGELIGIDYLYRQAGRALQHVQPDSE